jgi:DNA integrity scanning protein DisA with diadenylate cyclase activity
MTTVPTRISNATRPIMVGGTLHRAAERAAVSIRAAVLQVMEVVVLIQEETIQAVEEVASIREAEHRVVAVVA